MSTTNKDKAGRDVPLFDPAYHSRQWETCYESTKAFLDFLAAQGVVGGGRSSTVVDLCCGSGANLYWMKQRHPDVGLIGVDVIPDLIDFGRDKLAAADMAGIELKVGDVYDLDPVGLPSPDGIIALQTISWLPDEVGFVRSAAALEADWIALTGLMIEGSRSYRCLVSNEEQPDAGVNYYNTFSIDYLEGLFADAGYGDMVVEPFEIGIDLAKPEDPTSGTYTERTADGRRLQISGAILMTWGFLMVRRQK